MSEPKVQLLDPQGNINLPGINATGVITASSLDGAGGVVTGLTGNPNLNVGVVTATSFVGDGTGHAANLTGTPNLNLGLTTATSFVGDATGKAAGLTGTPNLNVGLITATSFVGDVTGDITGNITGNVTGNIVGDVTGNITGLASSIKSGNSLGVGVCTAIQYHGDGSNLTGAGSTAYVAQEITATGAETIIDLSDGNIIYYKGNADTTVGFASTSAGEQITLVRDTDPNYNISYSSGGVDFDGTGDYITMQTNSTDFDFGSGDFTIEGWIYPRAGSSLGLISKRDSGGAGNTNWVVYIWDGAIRIYISDGSSWMISGLESSAFPYNTWGHFAVVRNGNTFTIYKNGVASATEDDSGTIASTSRPVYIGLDNGGASTYFNGILSNLRVVKGTAVYTSDFVPPSAALTNISGTVLLCCQSDSSTTTAAVAPQTITASGDPTAGAETVALTGSLNASITWPSTVKWSGGLAPTLVNNERATSMQIFHFTTADTGATYQAWEEMVTNLDTYGLWAIGNNIYGLLGLNQGLPGTGGSRSSPIQVGTDLTWNKISSSFEGNVLSTKSDGTLWSWGSGTHGQLGLNQGSNIQRSSPCQVGTDTTWSSFGQASGGNGAIKTDGNLWVWGANGYGELGLNAPTNAHQSSPTQIPGSWSQYNRGGGSTSAAIKTDGTLWGWGWGRWGQLFNSNMTLPGAIRSSPTQIGANTNWANIDAMGENSSFALKTDSTSWSWGYNGQGQLGHGDRTNRSSPVQIPGTWSSMSYGGGVGLGLKPDGTLWSWGAQQHGSLGQNNATVRLSSPTQIGTETTWNRAVASYYSAYATKTDGTLWAWGYNGWGQFGQNDTTSQSSPVQIPGTAWTLDNTEELGTSIFVQRKQ